MSTLKFWGKLISVISCLTLLLTAFAGCGDGDKGKDNSGTGGSGPAVSDSVFSVEDVKYTDENNDAVYRVVRPDNDSTFTAASAKVYKAFKDINIKIGNVSDSEDGTDRYEILVGATNRAESQTAIDYLYGIGKGRYDDFIICTIGKKIVINAITAEGVEKAVDYFNNNYVKAEGIGGGIKHISETEGTFSDITVNGIGIQHFKLIRDMTSRSYLIQVEAEKLIDYVKATTGFVLKLEEDKTTAESEYEIIIGNAERPGTPDESSYGYDGYEIKISGKKVYLAGGSTYAVQVAVTEFLNTVKKGSVTDSDSKTGSYAATVAGYDSASYYRYVWGDEFDGDTLDVTKWVTPQPGDMNGEVPTYCYADENTCQLVNGVLVQRAFMNDEGGYDHNYVLMSSDLFRYNKGYIEMRARIPDGKGIYSSFWGNGRTADNTGDLLEIDIFESLGTAHKQQANVHYWYANGDHTSLDGKVTDRFYMLDEGTLFDMYHTIGFLWTEDTLNFYYDGELYYSQPATEFEADKFINVYAGFNVGWKGRTLPDNNSLEWPLEYHIDYIRLYQIDGQNYLTKDHTLSDKSYTLVQ